MKTKFILSLIAITAMLTGSLSAANPLAPDAKLQGIRNEVLNGATLTIASGATLTAASGSTINFSAGTLYPTGNITIASSKSLTVASGGTLTASSGSAVALAGTLTNTGSVNHTTGTVKSGSVTVGVPFSATATLTSAAAATPVSLLADAAVPTGKKVYITGYFVKVSGATDWATTTSVKIQDTNGTPVDFVTLTASTLDGNEFHNMTSDSATIESAMALGTGGTAAKGLQLVGNANGTGSDLVITVTGFIK